MHAVIEIALHNGISTMRTDAQVLLRRGFKMPF